MIKMTKQIIKIIIKMIFMMRWRRRKDGLKNVGKRGRRRKGFNVITKWDEKMISG